MSVLSGYQKINRYIKQSGGYKKLSQWTSSQTVQMDDGHTLQTNLGNIKGITSSLATTNANYALSATAGKSLQDQITTLNNGLGTVNDRIDGLNETTSRIINEDLAKIGSGATVVGKANIAINGSTPYNGGNGPVCTSLTSNIFQFRWSNNQIEVYVDKTRIGYMTTH